MSKYNLLSFIISLMFCTFVQALESVNEDKLSVADFPEENLKRQKIIGKVIKVHGKASVLNYNHPKPQLVEKNQYVLNDSSYYCYKGCYLTIKLRNKLSYVKIGQQSSVFILKNNDEYIVRLNSGFIKTLFKASDVAKTMKIMSFNSLAKTSNSKSLFIFNPLLKKTSLLNYKGNVGFQSLKGKKNARSLGVLSYSYLDKDSLVPTEPEILAPNRLEQLLSAFKIDSKKLD